MAIPVFQFMLPPPRPPYSGDSKFVFYFCNSKSVL